MKQKHIDAAREARLWIAQIIAPLAGVVIMASPEARKFAQEQITKLQIRKMFNL